MSTACEEAAWKRFVPTNKNDSLVKTIDVSQLWNIWDSTSRQECFQNSRACACTNLFWYACTPHLLLCFSQCSAARHNYLAETFRDSESHTRSKLNAIRTCLWSPMEIKMKNVILAFTGTANLSNNVKGTRTDGWKVIQQNEASDSQKLIQLHARSWCENLHPSTIYQS